MQKLSRRPKRDFKMRSVLSGYFIVDLPLHLAIRSISKFHPGRKELRNYA
jgi:hypothetical protein